MELALDDFGTGYSSLSYLRRLPFDTLKVDWAFVQGIESQAEDAALLGSIIAMAKALGLRVVAEGIETQAQREFLEQLDCDEIQGYLFCKPVCGGELADVLRWSETREREPRPSRQRDKASEQSSRKPATRPKKRASKKVGKKTAARSTGTRSSHRPQSRKVTDR